MCSTMAIVSKIRDEFNLNSSPKNKNNHINLPYGERLKGPPNVCVLFLYLFFALLQQYCSSLSLLFHHSFGPYSFFLLSLNPITTLQNQLMVNNILYMSRYSSLLLVQITSKITKNRFRSCNLVREIVWLPYTRKAPQCQITPTMRN